MSDHQHVKSVRVLFLLDTYGQLSALYQRAMREGNETTFSRLVNAVIREAFKDPAFTERVYRRATSKK